MFYREWNLELLVNNRSEKYEFKLADLRFNWATETALCVFSLEYLVCTFESWIH